MDKRIVRVEPITGKVIKATTCMGTPGFGIEVKMIEEDGTALSHIITRKRKKDVLTALQSQQDYAAAGALFATYDTNGVHWGFSQRSGIGTGPLVPKPKQ